MQYSVSCLEEVQIVNTTEKHLAARNRLFTWPIRAGRLHCCYLWGSVRRGADAATSRHPPCGQQGDGGRLQSQQPSGPVISAPLANVGVRVAGVCASLCGRLDRAVRIPLHVRIPGSARLWRGLGAVSTEHGAGSG